MENGIGLTDNLKEVASGRGAWVPLRDPCQPQLEGVVDVLDAHEIDEDAEDIIGILCKVVLVG